MRMAVDVDRDCVVLAFGSRGQTVGLNPEQARQVARALFDRSNEAALWVAAGGARKVVVEADRETKYGVQPKDEKVWLYFEKPTDRETMPFEAAKDLAHKLIWAIQQLGLRP